MFRKCLNIYNNLFINVIELHAHTIITVWNAVHHSFLLLLSFSHSHTFVVRLVFSGRFWILFLCFKFWIVSATSIAFFQFSLCLYLVPSCGNCFKTTTASFPFHKLIYQANERANVHILNEKREQENENYLVKWMEQSTTSIKTERYNHRKTHAKI